jgi:peptidoglycan/xylan/chitin deacetylase (PgdA/CDA1 family)
MSLPSYYSSLAPFRDIFTQGHPFLTYHHVGSRPRGVRIKGLYVSPKLFNSQVVELHEAGFNTTPIDSFINSTAASKKSVCLTFDDGFRDVFENALPVMRRLGFAGIQFLVSDLLGKTNEWQQRAGDVREPIMDAGQVRDWIASGQQIGAHTQTHPRLTQIPSAAAREEIFASKKSLEDRFGIPIDHFCYPYGDWNEPVRDLVIAAGYKSACTTISGVNTPKESRFELKRFTARYPSRNLKAIWSRLALFTQASI